MENKKTINFFNLESKFILSNGFIVNFVSADTLSRQEEMLWRVLVRMWQNVEELEQQGK